MLKPAIQLGQGIASFTVLPAHMLQHTHLALAHALCSEEHDAVLDIEARR
jgi:hypothetical protein